jgi:hypothetical protein
MVVDMVDPLEEGVVSSETTNTYVAHILGLVKSYWPKANCPLVNGMSAECFEEKFSEFVKEIKPVA